jgi:DNA-binding Lrp family transcriptional regulator
LRKPQKEILEDLRRLPFVYDAEMVTGDADLIMLIRARDTHDLGRLITEKVQGIPGIVNTKSLVSISY